MGEVYGLPRHLFEDGLAEWAERRGVLVKAIEDAALGVASVYRSLELPLPKQLPYASKEIRQAWADLLARFMPFDLVIDEHTADGQEARVSKTSVAGSWGAVAGALRFFADRFGMPRASHRGHHAVLRPRAGARRAGAAARGADRTRASTRGSRSSGGAAYFGFDLDTEVEPLRGAIPEPLRAAARDVLAEALIAGETTHPDQGRLRARGRDAGRALAAFRRRAGRGLARGRAGAASGHSSRRVDSWEDFLAHADRARSRSAGGRGDASAARRAAGDGARARATPCRSTTRWRTAQGVARVRLREGQAKRLRTGDLPPLDRPLRFAVQRGRHAPILADTVAELQARAPAGPEAARHDDDDRPPGRGRGGGSARAGRSAGRPARGDAAARAGVADARHA